MWAFHRILGEGFEIRCARSRFSEGLAGQWWRSEYGLVQVVIEYLKFAHYWMQYRNSSDTGGDVYLPDENLVREVICGKAPMESLERTLDQAPESKVPEGSPVDIQAQNSAGPRDPV